MMLGRLASKELLEEDSKSSDWVTVEYCFNRGIMHDGDFPHLSTPVTRIPESIQRVILGFNCFTEEVGDCCMRAPEHSDAFNRTIKLYQTVASLTPTAETDDAEVNDNSTCTSTKPRGITASGLLKNKALSKLLVMAARKVKEHQRIQSESDPIIGRDDDK